MQHYRKSRRLRPSRLHLSGGARDAQEETYDSSRDSHARELLLVVGARLRAVVWHKDDLLAFAMVNLICVQRARLKADRTLTAQQLESLDGSFEQMLPGP